MPRLMDNDCSVSRIWLAREIYPTYECKHTLTSLFMILLTFQIKETALENLTLYLRMEAMPEVKIEAGLDLENSLKQRLSKLTEELKQVNLEREEKIARIMFQNMPEILSKSFTADGLDSLSSSDMIELENVIVKTLEIIKKRLETLAMTHTSVTAATVDVGEATNEENVQPLAVKAYEVKVDNLENPPEHIELEPEVVAELASTDDNVMNSMWA